MSDDIELLIPPDYVMIMKKMFNALSMIAFRCD